MNISLCIKIFFARIVDVTMGTFRMIFIVKNKTLFATLIAFVEVVIWFLAAKYSFKENSSIIVAIFYAMGYAIGTLLGTHFSHKFNKTTSSVWAVLKTLNEKNIKKLNKNSFYPNIINLDNNKKLLYIEINTKDEEKLKNLLQNIDKSAFITQNENKIITENNNFIK